MEMVAAARLRRAEQRIEAMRPYAQAIRKMTRQVSEAAGSDAADRRCSRSATQVESAGILLVTGDRGLAGSFNTQIIREGLRLKRELGSDGAKVLFSVVGRRGNSTMTLPRRGACADSYVGFTDRPAFTDAREISARPDLRLHRRRARPGRPRLQPLRLAADPVRAPPDAAAAAARPRCSARARRSRGAGRRGARRGAPRALWIYEPEAEELLPKLFEEYVDLSVYRALLESSASEHGARMTAMRNAAENAQE